MGRGTGKILYNKLKQLERKIKECYSPTYLYQSDFDKGTYIIDEPGYYILKEDIIFNPNSDHDWMPRPDQEEYKDHAFVLGFFAAICVKAKNVYINLNHHSIEQSKEHQLQQRFYSNIELGSSPFLPGQGPATFATKFVAAENVIIRKGKLGRSSHHGIHGNNTKNVLIEHLKITGFEFVGVALNGGSYHYLHKLNIKDNDQDVPVLATYSASRFIRLFAQHLLTSDKLSTEEKNTLEHKLDLLNEKLDNAFNQIMNTGETTESLFRNEERLPDGNVFGVVLHSKGVAVHDFQQPEKGLVYQSNVYLKKVCVKDLKARVDEVVAISLEDGEGAQVDTAGAVLQINRITDSNGRYSGNALSDLQIYLAELSHQLDITLGTLNITSDIVEWSKGVDTISDLLSMGYVYQLNVDSMFHINKGVIGYRFGGVKNLRMKDCYLDQIQNKGYLGNETLEPYHMNGSDYYTGAQSIGVSISCCKNIKIKRSKLRNIKSDHGDSTGIDIMNSSKQIKLYDINISKLRAGKGCCKEYKHNKRNYYPWSVGIKIKSSSDVDIDYTCIKDLKSCKYPRKIVDFD